jgi:hypothetical protein
MKTNKVGIILAVVGFGLLITGITIIQLLGLLLLIAAVIKMVFFGSKEVKVRGLKTGLKTKWFSWGWLIFWIIVCWPVAIVYMLIKMGNRNKGC